MSTDVVVPTLGESITEATIGQWLKAPGDAVALDEPIASLETDKVSVEVPSPVAGTLSEQLFKEGDTVAVGAILARVGEGAAAAPHPPRRARPASAPAPEAASEAGLRLSPAVRRAVLEAHVDPSSIKGSGKDGRLTKDDVLAAAKSKESAPAQAGALVEAKATSSPAPTAPASAGAQAIAGGRREERVKMTRLRQTIATRLKEAQNSAALLTTFTTSNVSVITRGRATRSVRRSTASAGSWLFREGRGVAANDSVVNARIEATRSSIMIIRRSGAVSSPNGLCLPVSATPTRCPSPSSKKPSRLMAEG